VKGAHAYFSGSGGIRLHYRCWEVAAPRAAVLIAHGIGEHSGRYQELAADFARAGLSTYALDHRGHGRSDGRRGHVRRFVQYVHDLERFRRRVHGAVGLDLPLVFLGHSLGGLILIRYLQEYPAVPTCGAILSAPALGVAMEVPRWKERLARLLNYTVPALPMSTGLDPALLSHDPQVVEAYRRDPLVHDRITPRTYAEMGREARIAFERARVLPMPILLLVPSGDRLVRPDLMQAFAAAVGRDDRVDVITYADAYHEVLNETIRSRVVADVLGWIERRIAAAAARRA
jgi:alpha-beta hydrolase superfamily lysophospholipase